MVALINPWILGPSVPAEASAYFAAWSTQPNATLRGHLVTWIAGLITDGVWPACGALFFFAAPDQQAACVCVSDPAGVAALPTGSPLPGFTADRGYTSNGTGWVDTQRSINGGIPGLTQNNAHLYTYSAWTANVLAVGNQGTQRISIGRVAGPLLGTRCTTGAATNTDAMTGAAGRGAGCARNASAGYDRYIDGVTATPAVVASQGLSASTNLSVLANAGTIVNAGVRCAMISAGAYLSAADMAALHARTSTLMVAIGAN